MKKSSIKSTLLGVLAIVTFTAGAQIDMQPNLQNYRVPGFDGLNTFEIKKDKTTPFSGLKVRVGGDFALQFQGIDHENKWNSDSLSGVPELTNLGANFNLPTANLNLDIQLADGLRMHLRTYLSSRHHNEAYVKGGYIQMDKLDFIKAGFLNEIMDFTTIKIGMDELNYGDAHFRRSDNASAIYNPFVGNYIMDAFTTEAFAELTFMPSDFIIVAGVSNGNLNQSVTITSGQENKMSFYTKLGWDKQINTDTRVRITGSFITSTGYYNGGWLYAGDRAGSRYYHVMEETGSNDDFRSGRFNPNFMKFNSFQMNPFVKWKGLEFFGIYEMTMGDKADDESKVNGNYTLKGGSYTQLGAELIYRFGSWDQFYGGVRYNSVSGYGSEFEKEDLTTGINRLNVGFGWFMTKNVMAKLEYVNQSYTGDGYDGSTYEEGNFNGVMFEAVIGF